jgi:putative transcription factor
MICEMCGKETDSLTSVRVEGTVLRLCAACGKFGTAVGPPSGRPQGRDPDIEFAEPRSPTSFRTRSTEERDVFSDMPEMELAADWFRRVRHQRELLGWTPEELGKRLNEKKSLVLKVESGAFRPPDLTLRKIERMLKIRLTVDPNAPAP